MQKQTLRTAIDQATASSKRTGPLKPKNESYAKKIQLMAVANGLYLLEKMIDTKKRDIRSQAF
jgi:hypothetical protein